MPNETKHYMNPAHLFVIAVTVIAIWALGFYTLLNRRILSVVSGLLLFAMAFVAFGSLVQIITESW